MLSHAEWEVSCPCPPHLPACLLFALLRIAVSHCSLRCSQFHARGHLLRVSHAAAALCSDAPNPTRRPSAQGRDLSTWFMKSWGLVWRGLLANVTLGERASNQEPWRRRGPASRVPWNGSHLLHCFPTGVFAVFRPQAELRAPVFHSPVRRVQKLRNAFWKPSHESARHSRFEFPTPPPPRAEVGGRHCSRTVLTPALIE